MPSNSSGNRVIVRRVVMKEARTLRSPRSMVCDRPAMPLPRRRAPA